jgi:hypothetical protein
MNRENPRYPPNPRSHFFSFEDAQQRFSKSVPTLGQRTTKTSTLRFQYARVTDTNSDNRQNVGERGTLPAWVRRRLSAFDRQSIGQQGHQSFRR